MRKVFMRVASLFLWVVMIISAACISFAAEVQNRESSVIETETTETSDGLVYDETTEPSTEEKTIEETTTEEVKEWVLIEYTKDDITVIPDKYNTGCKGELIFVELGATVNGITFKASTNDTRNALDFYYGNKSVEGTVVFENYDFSDYGIWIYNDDYVDREINLVFNNCKFSTVSTNKKSGNISYEFYNCTFERFSGSNAVFDGCQFGRSICDGVVPFQDVTIKNCFFLDMARYTTGGSVHVDGTQIYGAAGIDVQNIIYDNCRFEIPPLKIEGSTASINACIMLQLEYSNGKNLSFTNCVLNGGGNSIYAWSKNSDYVLEDVVIDGIRSGCAKNYGTFYSKIDASVEIANVSETDTLYIASVWKDDKGTHFSVTNDTNLERKLLIVTDKKTYEYVIPACPKGSEMGYDMSYSDFPFDIDVVVPEDCKYAICFDNVFDGMATQIRFLNWTNEKVYLEKDFCNELTDDKDDIIFSGTCGANIDFFITKEGKLVLNGTGNMTNYHSKKLAPWEAYLSFIRTIEIGEGIESIGEQSFRNCNAVQTVLLPDSLTTIGKRAFSGCTCLTTITIPKNVCKIGESAFLGSILQEIQYEGDDWDDIELGGGNESLSGLVTYVSKNIGMQDMTGTVLLQGMCGEQIEYMLISDGTLLLIGEGRTYNYHSKKTAPWYEMRDIITNVVIGEGIEQIGEQLFRGCTNLSQVTLPQSLLIIGKNAFISCVNLDIITIPCNVIEIKESAFAGVRELSVIYVGTEESWNQILIGSNNGSVYSDLCFA